MNRLFEFIKGHVITFSYHLAENYAFKYRNILLVAFFFTKALASPYSYSWTENNRLWNSAKK